MTFSKILFTIESRPVDSLKNFRFFPGSFNLRNRTSIRLNISIPSGGVCGKMFPVSYLRGGVKNHHFNEGVNTMGVRFVSGRGTAFWAPTNG